MKGASKHFHFLLVLAGTYDNTVRNIDVGRVGYLRHSFIAGFPTERVPKMPLSGVSTRSGDLARFTFKGLDGTMTAVGLDQTVFCTKKGGFRVREFPLTLKNAFFVIFLIQHQDARAEERHQLVGHQVDEPFNFVF